MRARADRSSAPRSRRASKPARRKESQGHVTAGVTPWALAREMPEHSSSQVWRQAAMLQAQQRHGNASARRLLVERRASAGSVQRRPADESWSHRVKSASRNEDYVELLMEVTGVPRDQIHVTRGRIDPETGGPADAKPDCINFVPNLPGKGRTVPRYIPAERTGELPRPKLLIGRSAFKSASPVLLQSTVAHERKHVSHLEGVLELIRKWRKSGSKDAFRDWVWDLLKPRNDRKRKRWKIPDEVYYIARNRTEKSGSSKAVTEAFSYLEGFITGFHLIPEEEYASEPKHPMLLTLDQLADEWARLPSNKLQESIVQRLRAYYRKRSGGHRRAFDRFVKDRGAELKTDRSKFRQVRFYEKLQLLAGKSS